VMLIVTLAPLMPQTEQQMMRELMTVIGKGIETDKQTGRETGTEAVSGAEITEVTESWTVHETEGTEPHRETPRESIGVVQSRTETDTGRRRESRQLRDTERKTMSTITGSIVGGDTSHVIEAKIIR